MAKAKIFFRAGVAAVIAAGVAVLFAQTKKGKKLIAQGKTQAAELAKLVTQKTEMIKSLSKEAYEQIIDEVVADYQKQKKLTGRSAKTITGMLKEQWSDVKKEMKK